MTFDLDLLSVAIPHQIAILDENERYLFVNEAYARKRGRTVHEFVGKLISEFGGPTQNDIKSQVFPIPSGGFIHFSDDPGDRQWRTEKSLEEAKRLNAELEERVAQRTTEIEAANKELEAFCYSVSHDLRAPLRSIDGFAFALFQDYEDKLDTEGVEFINRIRSSAKRMDELISALLSLSRVTRTEIEWQDVDASAMAEMIASELQQQHPEKSLVVSIQPNLSIHADRRMIRVVLDNLLDNAVKFSSKHPLPAISFGRSEETGEFYVKDNGVGFNIEDSEKLFQPFERLHSPREFSGSGIGLATVQRIIRKHGGTIWAQSEVGKGSTFFFTV